MMLIPAVSLLRAWNPQHYSSAQVNPMEENKTSDFTGNTGGPRTLSYSTENNLECFLKLRQAGFSANTSLESTASKSTVRPQSIQSLITPPIAKAEHKQPTPPNQLQEHPKHLFGV
jgi:hypothetical protein